MARCVALFRDRKGSAAAEMAMVAPLLVLIMFGSVEIGNYFYNNHVVIKGVREGARYASRRAFANYSCPAGTITNEDPNWVIDDTKKVTRTGQTADGGTPRLWTWTNDTMVTVTLECESNSGGTYSGIYVGLAYVPVVRVSATVPYGSLLGGFGWDGSGATITAESEVPVMGI